MILTTTDNLETHAITKYIDLVIGKSIIMPRIFKDTTPEAFERILETAKDNALAEMKAKAIEMDADAVIGIGIDYESIYSSATMVAATGTAVKCRRVS